LILNERRHGGINYLTPNQKLLNPHTKICKIYGLEVKLTREDFLKENSKAQKPSIDLSRPVDGKLTINSNLFVLVSNYIYKITSF